MFRHLLIVKAALVTDRLHHAVQVPTPHRLRVEHERLLLLLRRRLLHVLALAPQQACHVRHASLSAGVPSLELARHAHRRGSLPTGVLTRLGLLGVLGVLAMLGVLGVLGVLTVLAGAPLQEAQPVVLILQLRPADAGGTGKHTLQEALERGEVRPHLSGIQTTA